MSRGTRSLTVLFALLSVFYSVDGGHVYEMNIVNITYGSLSNEVEINMTVNQNGLMTLNAVLHKESSDYHHQIIVAFDDGSGQYNNIFLNKTLQVCKFLTTPSYETFLQLYYRELIKHENNIPTACPIGGSGGVHYFIRNVEMNAMPVPPYVPGSNAYIYIIFMVKESDGQFRNLSTGKVFMNFRKLK